MPRATEAASPRANSNDTFLVFEDICVTKNTPESNSPIASVITPYVGYISVAIGESYAICCYE